MPADDPGGRASAECLLGNQEDIGRVSGERQERMNTICNIDQRERKKRQGRAAAYCSSSREQMRSMRFREQQVLACNLLG